MGFFDYIRLQMESKCVLSDSGTISEESAILNFPALNLRESHERPEAMEEASVMMVGVSIDRVKHSLNILAKQKRGVNREIQIPIDYTSPNVSEKVVRIIHSYTDYINRVIWKKY
jgi:UDP-N-acetylglucosamine 2-epimerase (non-hydrolysing)